MIVSFGEILVLSAVLFFMGLACTITRKNLIMILIGVEIMLNSAGLVFVGGALRHQAPDGQAFVLFLFGVAAAEVAVGLALIVYARRLQGTIKADRFNSMGG